MDKNPLKKQHFWILTGVAPLLTLIAVVMIWTEVGGAIDTRYGDIHKQKKQHASPRAPGQKLLKDYDEQIAELARKKNQLWNDNWQRQSVTYKLFDWPQDNDSRQRLRKLEKQYAKFGEPIRDPEDAFEVFKRKDVYEAAYAKVAESIRPTTFLGGRWQNVLRHVSDWGQKKPTSDQIWLALEDFWVQRGLLKPIEAVNESAARFQLVPPAAGSDDPFHRVFRNKVWELELWIDNNGADNLIRAKLTNRTDRLQLLGLGNTMHLKVWLSDQKTAQPIDFRIEGEFVPALGTIVTKPVPRLHGIPPGTEKQKIAQVEQVLDTRTVPIRRVDIIEVGTLRSLDARHYASISALQPPGFMAPNPGATTSTMPMGTEESEGPAMIYPGGIDPMMTTGPGTQPKAPAIAGTPESVLLANKNRYLGVSPQVRRMPFAVSLVVDQMFMQDALVAYANSPMRCQITQFYWQRFRGSLKAPATPGTPGSMPGAEDPGYIENPETYVLPFGQGMPEDPRGPGFGPGMSGRSSSVSEGQVTSGLVQLTIHGVLTLYEKYEEPKPAGDPSVESVPGMVPMAPKGAIPSNPNNTGNVPGMVGTPAVPPGPTSPTTQAGVNPAPTVGAPATPPPGSPANPASPPSPIPGNPPPK